MLCGGRQTLRGPIADVCMILPHPPRNVRGDMWHFCLVVVMTFEFCRFHSCNPHPYFQFQMALFVYLGIDIFASIIPPQYEPPPKEVQSFLEATQRRLAVLKKLQRQHDSAPHSSGHSKDQAHGRIMYVRLPRALHPHRIAAGPCRLSRASAPPSCATRRRDSMPLRCLLLCSQTISRCTLAFPF